MYSVSTLQVDEDDGYKPFQAFAKDVGEVYLRVSDAALLGIPKHRLTIYEVTNEARHYNLIGNFEEFEKMPKESKES